MKKSIFTLGLAFIAALSLTTNCVENPIDPNAPEELVNKKAQFELFAAAPDTRTTTTDGVTINWVGGTDALNVFHAENGTTTYGTNDEFSIAAEDVDRNRFTGTLTEALEAEKAYDWYVLYPYSSYIKTPANTNKGYLAIGSTDKSTAQTQNGNSNKAHLAGQYFPLYGKVENVPASEKPSITLNQALSVVKVHVTNSSGTDLTVTNVSFTATEDIVGTYYINFVDNTPGFTSSGDSYVSSTANLTVNSGAAITDGDDADFYIAVKPFTAPANSQLKVIVNGTEKTIHIGSSSVEFKPGKIKTVNFTFDTDPTATVSTVFIFNTSAGLSELGITEPTTASTGTDLTGPYTKNGISLTFDVNGGSNTPKAWKKSGGLELRTYVPNILTFDAPTGYVVTAIEFSSNGSYDANVGEYSGKAWSGSAAQVSLTRTGSGNHASNTISVTCEKNVTTPDTRSEAGIEWDDDEGMGDVKEQELVLPNLTNPNSLTVTYSSSDETVATVEANAHTITLLKAGTTEIHAVFAGNDDYKPADVYYTLTVDDTRTDVTLSFDPTSYVLTIGTDDYNNFTGQVVTASTNVAVTYAISGENIGTLNTSTGAVSLNNTIGTATITASFAGDATHKPAEDASYTVTVSPSGTIGDETFDLSTNTYTTGTDLVTWTGESVVITNSGTNATNYLGGDANNRTSSRFYSGNSLVINPNADYMITSIVFTAATENYATILRNSTWSNGSASVSSTTVTVTPENGNNAVSATIGNTCGVTSIVVNYVYTGATKYNIAINGSIENGSVTASANKAVAGASVTLTATPASGYALDTWDVYKTGESSTKVTVTNNSFTMPAYDVTVSASFVTVPTITMNTTSITGVAAAGVSATATNAYNLVNGASNADVSITCDGTVVTAASKNATAGSIDYTVAVNTSGSRDGWIKVKYGSEAAHEITVSQLAGISGGTVVFTPSSQNEVNVTGDNNGITATYSNTYNNANQMTGGNSCTLTISGLGGKTITAISINARNNKSSGSGTLTITTGSNNIINSYTLTGLGNTYTDIPLTVVNGVVSSESTVVMTIACSTNSTFFGSLSITYE